MTETPAISVALCTYNGAAYLAEQLHSIRGQTLPPAELVVSDDGSTDRTLAIAEDFARSAPFPVRVVRQPVNLGVVQNFASALALCGGGFIALCDQDDVWQPDKLRVCADFLLARPECWAVFTDATVTDENLRPHATAPALWQHVGLNDGLLARIAGPQTSLPLLSGSNYVTGATVVIRRELLRYLLPIPAPETLPALMLHDYWLALVAAALGRLDSLDRRTILYRQHSRQQAGLIREPVRRSLRLPRKLFTTVADDAEKLHAVLAPRLAGQAVPGVLEYLRSRTVHFRLRATLPASRPRRLGPILGEWKRGGYRRFCRRPLVSAARDLVL